MKNTTLIGDTNWADPARYSLSNLVVRTRRPAGSYREIAVVLANDNTMVDSEFVLEGRPEARVRATLADKTAHPFPNSGKVMVKDDALLELAVSGLGNNEGFQEKGKAQIEIRGGALHQLSGNQFTDLYRLKVNGGTLAFAPGAAEGKRYTANWKDANTYIGGIEYSNGAKTVGASPRMGLNNTGSVVNFSVSGNLPCRAEHGIDVVGVYTSNFIAFDIDDVTGNGETDFTMTGAVLPHSDGLRLFKVVKTGEGTLEFLGANDYTNYPTYVRGGTLRLGASGVMHAKMNLSLEGGSFAVAAGTSNILGRLAVSADADITVESAAELSFADSSDVAWGNDLFRLNIVQSEGASVRFGENASSLTQNQLRRIRLNGRTCKIDENGYLRQRMGPVIVIR